MIAPGRRRGVIAASLLAVGVSLAVGLSAFAPKRDDPRPSRVASRFEELLRALVEPDRTVVAVEVKESGELFREFVVGGEEIGYDVPNYVRLRLADDGNVALFAHGPTTTRDQWLDGLFCRPSRCTADHLPDGTAVHVLVEKSSSSAVVTNTVIVVLPNGNSVVATSDNMVLNDAFRPLHSTGRDPVVATGALRDVALAAAREVQAALPLWRRVARIRQFVPR